MAITFYCPFYIFDRNNMVRCDNQKKKFENYKEKHDYIKKYCCCYNWTNCPNAKELLTAYDENEGGNQK